VPYKYKESRSRAVRKYYLKNRKRILKQAKERARKLKETVLSHYGNKCACCGEDRLEFLCIDHIYGGGNEFRKLHRMGGGTTFYYWVIKNSFPDDLQVLCWNCNMAKAKYGYCPHREQ